MSSEEISILNNKKSSGKEVPVLSSKTSSSFQIVEKKEKVLQKAVDIISINKKNFDLQFKSAQEIPSSFINRKSSEILGLSLGDINSKKENRFVEQLTKNRLTTNSAFYFEFQELKKTKCKVPTLNDYLVIK